MGESWLSRDIISGSDGTTEAARNVLVGGSKKGRFGKLFPFLGPAFVASVAYIDPGNFATNIQGGAQFGYTLLWVIVASILMAILLQSLTAKAEGHIDVVVLGTHGRTGLDAFWARSTTPQLSEKIEFPFSLYRSKGKWRKRGMAVEAV